LCSNVECRKVSNAFEKSSEMTMTYGSVSSRLVTELSKEMMAAVVEPVGRNANWSAKWRVGGGDVRAGYYVALCNYPFSDAGEMGR